MDIEEFKIYNELIESLNIGDSKRIKKAKYDFIFYGRNILEVVTNFMLLSSLNVEFNFGHETIKKGTKLFRIRQYSNEIDFNDLDQWKYPPTMPENRANKNGEPALYLGTTENVCLLETHIKKDEKYVLGEYIVTDDITLGGFLSCEDIKSSASYLLGVILNAFLIAPSRSEKNNDLFKALDEIYGEINLNDLNIKIANDIDLPIKFGLLNRKFSYYELTNKLIRPIKNKYSEGLSYSSCYIPISTVFIKCSDSNIVLFDGGFKKIKFIGYSVKTNTAKFTDIDILKILINLKKEKEK